MMKMRLLLSFIMFIPFSPVWILGQPKPISPVSVPPPVSNLKSGQTAPKVEDIWVVFKTHCDLGYTMSAEEVLKKYREEMMDNAIRLVEDDRKKPEQERFKWTIAGWPMWGDILGPLQTSERKAKVEQALCEGSIAVHALSCTMESDAFEAEDYVRSLGFSSKVARTYGQQLPVSGKMTDVPAHSWLLPVLLKHAGIGFLQLGCNYADRPIMLPHLFWWEGPDGSRILCNYTANYGSGVVPPKDWPAKNYLAVVMTHDNEGPPSPQEVVKIKEEAAKLPGVRLHFGTMDDFAKAVLAENPDLPVVRGDMVDPWIHGVASMPVESAVARNIRPLEPALEIIDTQMRMWGLDQTPVTDDLSKAYEFSMLFGEHTWGGMTPGWGYFSDNGTNRGTERYLYGDNFRKAREKGYYKKFESSFEDHRAYIRQAEALVSGNLNKRLELLVGHVRFKGNRILVYNPLPWTRSGAVKVNGKDYFADQVPPCGYLVLPALAEKAIVSAKVSGNMVETKYFKAHFDLKRGGLASLIEKSTGRELVDQSAQYVLGQFLHEYFSEEQTLDYYNRYCLMNNAANATLKPNMPNDARYQALVPSKWEMEMKCSLLADTVVLSSYETSGIAKGVVLAFTFPKANPYIDIEWRIIGKVADPIPEGGWLCFPLAVKSLRFLAGRLGGTIDLAKDQITGGNRHLYAINTGIMLAGKDNAIGLCSPDAPCMSFGEPGLWKYSFDYLPKKSWVFVNLYNNMWNTNFPYWTDGSWKCRVRFWPVMGNEDLNTNLAVKSWETRVPLLVATDEGKGRTLPVKQTGISVSRPGVLVTAFGQNADGEGTLLRVWDQTGTTSKLIVSLPSGSGFKEAVPVNLRGEKITSPLKIQDNKLEFLLKGFAPASFILTK